MSSSPPQRRGGCLPRSRAAGASSAMEAVNDFNGIFYSL